jgi:predicted PurR-regulated permease PerM
MTSDYSKLSKYLIVGASFTIVVSGLKIAAPIFVPFLLAIFISILVSPVLKILKSKGLSNGIAILIIIALIGLVGLFIGSILGASVADFRQDLPEYSSKLSLISMQIQQGLANIGLVIDKDQWSESFNPSILLAAVGSSLTSFGGVLTNSFLILLTVVFILTENITFSEKLKNATGNTDGQLWLENFATSVHSYIAIKGFVSLLTGFLVFVLLKLIGVEYAVLWSVTAVLLNFIPTVGSIIAAVPPVLLSLVQLSVPDSIFVLIGYLVINLFVGNYIEPRWMGKGLNLSPFVVFVSLVFWGWILGPVGMLLSIPLTILVKIGLETQEETKWIAVLLGDK